MVFCVISLVLYPDANLCSGSSDIYLTTEHLIFSLGNRVSLDGKLGLFIANGDLGGVLDWVGIHVGVDSIRSCSLAYPAFILLTTSRIPEVIVSVDSVLASLFIGSAVNEWE